MLGHEIRLSQTNNCGWVPLCECGWIGTVVPVVGGLPTAAKRSQRRIELTQAIARARHGAHLEDVRADVIARSDAEIARIGRLIPFANATFQRRGRWGHP